VGVLALAGCALAAITLLLILSAQAPGRPPRREAPEREARLEEELRSEPRRPETAREESETMLARLREEEARLDRDRKREEPDPDLKRKAEEAFADVARRRSEEEVRLRKLRESEEAAKRTPAERPPAPSTRDDPAAGAAVARLEKTNGKVNVLAGGEPAPAREGQALPRGCGLESSDGESSALLVYPDGTRVALGPATALGEIGDKLLFVARGVVTATVARQRLGERMAFRTPHGEVTVLGTTLRIVVNPDPREGTRVEVEQGKVRLKDLAGKTADVPAGYYALAAAGVEPAARMFTLFSEDFDSGMAGEWTFPRKLPWTLERGSPRGWVLKSPSYPPDQKVPESDLLAVLGGKSWKDLSVEADVRLEESPGGSAGFALSVRYQDWSNLVRLEYGRFQGQWAASIDQGRPGVPGDLVAGQAPPLEVGRTRRIRLEARGEDVSAWVDGRLLLRAKTLFDGPGTLALGAPGGRLSFDNLKVTALPPPPKNGRGGKPR
jgi:hypothetical protein